MKRFLLTLTVLFSAIFSLAARPVSVGISQKVHIGVIGQNAPVLHQVDQSTSVELHWVTQENYLYDAIGSPVRPGSGTSGADLQVGGDRGVLPRTRGQMLRDKYAGVDTKARFAELQSKYATANGGYDKLNGQGLYILRDQDGVIRYVGIGDVPTRLSVHQRDFKAVGPHSIKKGELFAETVWDVGSLTKAQARGLEQKLIGKFGGPLSRSGTEQLINKAVSFSTKNSNHPIYRHAVSKDLWKSTLKKLKQLDQGW